MLIDDDLVPVRRSEIVIGKPMPWAAYDANRNLLLNRGVVVTSMAQVEGLLQRGLFRAKGYGGRRSPGEMPEVAEEADVGSKSTEYIPLEDLKLSPGDVLQLQPLMEGTAERYNVKMIGYTRGKSILAGAPEVDGKLVHVREGQTFGVRAFSGLVIGSFTTKVLKSQFSPYPYLHLAYPASVQAIRLRRSMRASVNLVAAVYDKEDGEQIGAGVITDLSMGGARIMSPRILGRKDRPIFLSFKVKLSDMEEYVKAPAIIRAVAVEGGEEGNRQYAHGLQFGQMNPHHQLIIMNLVYRHLYKDAI